MRRTLGVTIGLSLTLLLSSFACGGNDKNLFTSAGGSAGAGGTDSGGSSSGGSSMGGTSSGGSSSGGSSAGGTMGGTGGGGCDCPYPENSCIRVTCENDVCSTELLVEGEEAAEQVPGDCHVVLCDGDGETRSIEDNSDLPDDGDDCTLDVCRNGVPEHSLAPAGTECSAGVCSAEGECHACNTATDCPGDDTECRTRTCDDGVCGESFASDGEVLSAQTDGDCRRVVCDGSGGTRVEADGADLPDDTDDCTADSCDGQDAVHTVTPGASCGTADGQCNDAGQCVGCEEASDCGTDTFCVSFSCGEGGICETSFTAQNTELPSPTLGDCSKRVCNGQGRDVGVADDTDLPQNNNSCLTRGCSQGTPTETPANQGDKCDGGVCNGTGSCVECVGPGNCTDPPGACVIATCLSNVCGSGNATPGTKCGDASCSNGMEKDIDQCGDAGNCLVATPMACAPYVCGATACAEPCTNSNDCIKGRVCNAVGQCIEPPDCPEYCSNMTTACTAGNEQYDNETQCLAACAAFARNRLGSNESNTLTCRLDHSKNAVAGSPGIHCPHAGPSGDGTCGSNCQGYCALALYACPGLYQDATACTTACAMFPSTGKYSTGVADEDSLFCRLHQMTMALGDASLCVEAGPNSDVCSDAE